MPTLLNINAVKLRQLSFNRSANGGFCRRRIERLRSMAVVGYAFPATRRPMATDTTGLGTTSGPPAAGLLRYGCAWPEVIFYSVGWFPLLESTPHFFPSIRCHKPRHCWTHSGGCTPVHRSFTCIALECAAAETTHQNYFIRMEIILLCLLLQPPLFSFIFLPVSFYSGAHFFLLNLRSNHSKVLKHFPAAPICFIFILELSTNHSLSDYTHSHAPGLGWLSWRR